MNLHVELDVRELSEADAADLALVWLLPGVDQQVFTVVGADPEGLPTMLAGVRFLSRVLQFVELQRLVDDEAFPADVAAEGPLSGVDPLVVVEGGFVVEGLPALVAVELFEATVAELVLAQGAGAGEAFVAGFTAERRQIHGGVVPSVDHPAVQGLRSRLAFFARWVVPPHVKPLAVVGLLVFLQVTVVQEGFPAQVAHEGLGGAVNQHVDFEFVLNEALSTDLTNERPLTCRETHSALW